MILVVAFASVPGSLQNLQRGEYWGVIPALQDLVLVHSGVDNKMSATKWGAC